MCPRPPSARWKRSRTSGIATYAQAGAHSDVYRYKVTAQPQLASVIDALWPWLGDVKRHQAALVATTLAAQPTLLRGRPDWGNRKTHCIKGHEYSTARVRPYRSRGMGVPVRENHRCLQCLREYARAQREKNKSAADDDRRSISDARTRYLLK